MPHERPGPAEYAPFYAGYVGLVPSGDIVATLAAQLDATAALLRDLSPRQAGYAYAPGKWSIAQVVGHLADSERILACRALRFARGDATPLPGFDENAYVPYARFEDRPLPGLIAELAAVRGATSALFAGLPPASWTSGGVANDAHVTVRALAWIIAGHELHHRQVLATRYLTAVAPARD
jgi:hypothetical protein